MRAALDLVRLLGTTYHTTREQRLDCGCVASGGWRTDTYEPFAGVLPCSPEHREAAQRAYARWGDDDSLVRFKGAGAVEALVALLRDEIG